MSSPHLNPISANDHTSSAVAKNMEIKAAPIDGKMTLLVRRLGELVGSALAAVSQTKHDQNNILKNTESE
jgi:hypothetical protein